MNLSSQTKMGKDVMDEGVTSTWLSEVLDPTVGLCLRAYGAPKRGTFFVSEVPLSGWLTT